MFFRTVSRPPLSSDQLELDENLENPERRIRENSGAADRAEVYIIGGSLVSRATPLIALSRGFILVMFSS